MHGIVPDGLSSVSVSVNTSSSGYNEPNSQCGVSTMETMQDQFSGLP